MLASLLYIAGELNYSIFSIFLTVLALAYTVLLGMPILFCHIRILSVSRPNLVPSLPGSLLSWMSSSCASRSSPGSSSLLCGLHQRDSLHLWLLVGLSLGREVPAGDGKTGGERGWGIYSPSFLPMGSLQVGCLLPLGTTAPISCPSPAFLSEFLVTKGGNGSSLSSGLGCITMPCWLPLTPLVLCKLSLC